MTMENVLIEQTAEVTAKRVVLELKKQGLLKDNTQTPFQKTETLLYNYNNFQEVIKDKEKQIEELQNNYSGMKSKSITSFSTDPRCNFTSEAEEKADEIAKLENNIRVTKNFIKTINAALDLIREDPYFDIIRMKYFDGATREEMADHFGVDVKTITRNKNKLINKLQIKLFSDEYITRIFA